MPDYLQEKFQYAALAELHPSWLPCIAPDILNTIFCLKMPYSKMAKAWLAKRLSNEFTLFKNPIAKLESEKNQHYEAWLLNPIYSDHAFLLETGALAYGSNLRTIVARDERLRLSRVLGEVLYEKAQKHNLSACPELIESIKKIVQQDEKLLHGLLKQSYKSLLLKAVQCHPYAVERVVLAFPADWFNAKHQLLVKNK